MYLNLANIYFPQVNFGWYWRATVCLPILTPPHCLRFDNLVALFNGT